MKKRDRRKRRERRLMRKALAKSNKEEPPEKDTTVKVIRDTRGRQYIKAPDGSLRRPDKAEPEKLDWLSET